MKIACVLAVVLVLAATVVAKKEKAEEQKHAKIELKNTNGKWTWELVSKDGKNLLTSEPFDDKKSCARSAVALLANGGDKDRCKAGVGVTNVNGVTIGATRGDEDVESEKQHIRIPAGKTIDCEAVHIAIKDIVENFVKTHADGQAIGKTKLKIEIKQSDKDKQFFFHIKAGNGEIVFRSEQYTAKANAINGLVSVVLNGGVKSSYEVKPSKDGKFSFNLKAANNEIVGASETYESEANAQRGRAGVQKKVRTMLATVVDAEAQEQQQQQPKPEQHKDLTEQQKKKKHAQAEQQKKAQQTEKAVVGSLPPNTVPTAKGQGVQTDVQATGQQPMPPTATTGQQQGQAPALDDNDVAEDDSDDDVDDDDDDSDF